MTRFCVTVAGVVRVASEEVIEILGGKSVVVLRPLEQPSTGVAKAARPGSRAKAVKRRSSAYGTSQTAVKIKTRAIKTFSQRLAVEQREMLDLINVRGRTAQRRIKQEMLTDDESDRLYRVARVTGEAERTFGSTEKAHTWLKRANKQFDGATPLSLLGTDAGAEAVTHELTRIAYGDLF